MCLYMHRNGAACCILKERRVDSFHSGLRPAATTVKVQDMQPAARQLLQFLIKDLEATKKTTFGRNDRFGIITSCHIP